MWYIGTARGAITKYLDPVCTLKLRGSEYPNSKVLGPKIHTLNGFWTLKPYYLGTWTLRETSPRFASMRCHCSTGVGQRMEKEARTSYTSPGR